MEEILRGVWHWTTFHEGIGQPVHSYYLAGTDPAVAIDPRVPAEGLGWFREHRPPAYILLTNRLHYRHSGRFARAFGATVCAHRAGMHAFGPRRRRARARPWKDGARLPGGIVAHEIGALCPEETALHVPLHGGILAIGDALVRWDDTLAFVPDFLMGPDPEGVKRGLTAALRRLLKVPFRHLLLAHGEPWIGGAKTAVRGFVAAEEGRR